VTVIKPRGWRSNLICLALPGVLLLSVHAEATLIGDELFDRTKPIATSDVYQLRDHGSLFQVAFPVTISKVGVAFTDYAEWPYPAGFPPGYNWFAWEIYASSLIGWDKYGGALGHDALLASGYGTPVREDDADPHAVYHTFASPEFLLDPGRWYHLQLLPLRGYTVVAGAQWSWFPGPYTSASGFVVESYPTLGDERILGDMEPLVGFKLWGEPASPAVPEPASCALLALAAGGIGATLRRRRKQ